MKKYINILWDDEAKVWIGTSDDIVGLVLESDSLDVLIENNKHAVPELIKLNRENGIIGLLLVFRSQGDPDKYAVEFVFGWHHVMSSMGDLRFDDNSGTLLLETRYTIYEYRIIEQVSLDRLVMVERRKNGQEDEKRRMH